MAIFGPNTKVTLGTVAAALLALGGIAMGAAKYVGAKFDTLDQTMQGTARGLDQVKKDYFTMTAASEHALRTAIENPGMRVPDPRDPSKVFVVDVGRRTGAPSNP